MGGMAGPERRVKLSERERGGLSNGGARLPIAEGGPSAEVETAAMIAGCAEVLRQFDYSHLGAVQTTTLQTRYHAFHRQELRCKAI